MAKTVGEVKLEVKYDESATTLKFPFDTKGNWEQQEFTFTIGSTVDADGLYINACDYSGTSLIIDNYEVYNITNTIPLIVSENDLYFNESTTQQTFDITGNNLTNDITLTAPTGITLDITTITANDAQNGVTVTATWDVLANIFDEDLTVSTIGIDSEIINIKAINESTCFIPLYSTGNLVTNPEMDDLNSFVGWGNANKSIEYSSDAYCGGSLKVNGSCGGSVNIDITWVANSTYRVRFMAKTTGGSAHIQAAGIDNTENFFSFDTFGIWEQQDFTFTTGANPNGINAMYINSCDGDTATAMMLDNYELYDMTSLSVDNVANNVLNLRVYPNPAKDVLYIDTKLEVSKIIVFDTFGRTVISKNKNLKSINVSKLSSGSYILHATVGNKVKAIKFIK